MRDKCFLSGFVLFIFSALIAYAIPGYMQGKEASSVSGIQNINYHVNKATENPVLDSGFSKDYLTVDKDSLLSFFNRAYQAYPALPKGLLEAISYHTTRLKHRTPGNSISCTGTPKIFGIMGLTEGGMGINNTLNIVSRISGYSIEELKSSPQKNILGTAKWLNHSYLNNKANLISVIHEYLGFADTSGNAEFLKNDFALQIIKSLHDGVRLNGIVYSEPDKQYEAERFFAPDFLDIYQNKRVRFTIDKSTYSSDYPGATWVGTNCYSSRNGTPVTDVVIHDMEGYFTYTVYTLFQNCDYEVSAHYCIRSNDGFIVQLVSEADKAWHVGQGNPYSIGLEHEGFADDPDWYTAAMYQASAGLVIDITQSGYGIAPTSCYYGPSNPMYQIDPQPEYIRIKGHCHYPFSTHWDPGPYWNWYLYYDLINDTAHPDLVIMAMWTEPASPSAEEFVDLYVEIKNAGDETASNISLDYRIDGNIVGTDTHNSLDPGDTQVEFLNNYVFDDPGDYEYCVYIDGVDNEENTANNSYCIGVVVSNTTGIYDTAQEQDIRVYPNPADDFLYYSVQGTEGIIRVEVSNKLGQTIKIIEKPNGKIDLSDMPEDLYFVKFINLYEQTRVFGIIKK